MFELFIAFLKIGSISVGGGYAMLPIIYQAVAEYGIMTKEVFSNLVAISQITPGLDQYGDLCRLCRLRLARRHSHQSGRLPSVRTVHLYRCNRPQKK